MSSTQSDPRPTKRLRYVTVPRSAEDRRRRLAAVSEATFLPMQAIGDHGQLDLSATRPASEVRSGYSQFFDGDVVVAKITPCFENGKGALIRGLREGVGFGTTELHVLTPGPEIEGRFLYYLTIQPRFRQLGAASMTGAAGQQRVSLDFIRNHRVGVPALSRQRAIADYLDCETARLDALVAEKVRVLELLAEKRRALIALAVTRGLDPGASFRHSGIPWLGEIVSDWETRRLAWLFRERDERGEPDLPLLKVTISEGVSLREFSGHRIETAAADFNTYKIARRGDVVFNKMRMWQGAVGIAPQDGLVSPDYVVAAPTGGLLPQYAGLLFRSDRFSAECARRSRGIVWDRLRLYWEAFRDIEVPLPSIETQQVIAHHVASAISKTDTLVSAAKGAIALLRERRAALIAATVTDRVDAECTP